MYSINYWHDWLESKSPSLKMIVDWIFFKTGPIAAILGSFCVVYVIIGVQSEINNLMRLGALLLLDYGLFAFSWSFLSFED